MSHSVEELRVLADKRRYLFSERLAREACAWAADEIERKDARVVALEDALRKLIRTVLFHHDASDGPMVLCRLCEPALMCADRLLAGADEPDSAAARTETP